MLFAALLLCCTSALHAVTWLPFGPDGGDARRIAADPQDPAHLYLGAANGWIYESHNFGANWVRLASVGQRDDLVLDHIIVDAKDAKHLIVGAWGVAGAPGGIFISYDAGKTWINQAEMRGQSIRSLAAATSDSKILIAGTLQGVFRSVDTGQRWKQISPIGSVELHNVQSIAIDPKDPNVIYAGTWHLPWKTTDGGETWANITRENGIIDDSDIFSIIIDPVKTSTIYASACSGIYKSVDAGQLFQKLGKNIIPNDARRTRILLQDPTHLETVFAGTTEGLYRSDDAGKNWTRTTGPDIIVNDILINPADSRKVLLATDRAGVLSSDDGGDTFHSANAGFSARQILSMKRDTRNPATLFIGVVNDKEWGGVFQSDNGGLAWQQRSAGLEGRDVFALGQAADGTMIAGTETGLYRLDSEAQAWKLVENGPSDAHSTATAHVAAPYQLRPPVPIGRNQFAERKLPKDATPAQKRAAVRANLRRPSPKVVLKGRRVVAKSNAAPRAAASRKEVAARKRPALKPSVVVAKRNIAPVAQPPVVTQAVAAPLERPNAAKGFDGSVSAIVNIGDQLLASTSVGLLTSSDNGASWTDAKIPGSDTWRYLAVAKGNLVSASLQAMQFSTDSGLSWSPIRTPEGLIQISAIAVEPSGAVWIGGRQGVFVSTDAGNTWTTPKNLYVTSVGSLFYDETTNRMIVTTDATNSVVFSVQMPQRTVTYAYSGWKLRFARPVGDHIVAATLFDGIVVQPKVLDSPATSPTASATR